LLAWLYVTEKKGKRPVIRVRLEQVLDFEAKYHRNIKRINNGEEECKPGPVQLKLDFG